jgi:hypothetical protein
MTIMTMQKEIQKAFPSFSGFIPDISGLQGEMDGALSALGVHMSEKVRSELGNIPNLGLEERALLGSMAAAGNFRKAVMSMQLPEVQIRFTATPGKLYVAYIFIKQFKFMGLFCDPNSPTMRNFCTTDKVLRSCSKLAETKLKECKDWNNSTKTEIEDAQKKFAGRLLNLELNFGIVFSKCSDEMYSDVRQKGTGILLFIGMGGLEEGSLPPFPGNFSLLSTFMNIPLMLMGGNAKRIGVRYISPKFTLGTQAMKDTNSLIEGGHFPCSLEDTDARGLTLYIQSGKALLNLKP